MTATYGPRINVHPDRIGADRSKQFPLVNYLILHTSEQSGLEDPNDAEDLGKFLSSPGDRPKSGGGKYGSSYHGITDTDHIKPCVPDTFVAYAAGGGNRFGLHLCFPVKAQSREQWLEGESRLYIRQGAEWIVDKARQYRIPLTRITSSQMMSGAIGYADHYSVSLAFKQSNHTDVGFGFPWDVLAADIKKITAPVIPPVIEPAPIPEPTPEPKEQDMVLIDPKTDKLIGLFTIDGHPVSPEAVAALKKLHGDRLVIVVQDHPHWDAATLDKMGAHARALYGS